MHKHVFLNVTTIFGPVVCLRQLKYLYKSQAFEVAIKWATNYNMRHCVKCTSSTREYLLIQPTNTNVPILSI